MLKGPASWDEFTKHRGNAQASIALALFVDGNNATSHFDNPKEKKKNHKKNKPPPNLHQGPRTPVQFTYPNINNVT